MQRWRRARERSETKDWRQLLVLSAIIFLYILHRRWEQLSVRLIEHISTWSWAGHRTEVQSHPTDQSEQTPLSEAISFACTKYIPPQSTAFNRPRTRLLLQRTSKTSWRAPIGTVSDTSPCLIHPSNIISVNSIMTELDRRGVASKEKIVTDSYTLIDHSCWWDDVTDGGILMLGRAARQMSAPGASPVAVPSPIKGGHRVSSSTIHQAPSSINRTIYPLQRVLNPTTSPFPNHLPTKVHVLLLPSYLLSTQISKMLFSCKPTFVLALVALLHSTMALRKSFCLISCSILMRVWWNHLPFKAVDQKQTQKSNEVTLKGTNLHQKFTVPWTNTHAISLDYDDRLQTYATVFDNEYVPFYKYGANALTFLNGIPYIIDPSRINRDVFGRLSPFADWNTNPYQFVTQYGQTVIVSLAGRYYVRYPDYGTFYPIQFNDINSNYVDQLHRYIEASLWCGPSHLLSSWPVSLDYSHTFVSSVSVSWCSCFSGMI